MAAYVIVSYDITNPEGYEGYVPAVLPLLEKHGAEILVAEFDAQPLEGTTRSVYVVLRFPSEEAARLAQRSGLRARAEDSPRLVREQQSRPRQTVRAAERLTRNAVVYGRSHRAVAGTYFVRLQAGGEVRTGKVVFLGD